MVAGRSAAASSGFRSAVLVRLLCVFGLLSASVAAAAQPVPGSREARDEARRWYRSARGLLDRGEAEAALANFEAAYDLYPHWSTMLGMGLAWEAMGDIPAAIVAFERALAEGGYDVPLADRAEVDARIAALRPAVAPPPPVVPYVQPAHVQPASGPPPGGPDDDGASGWVWGLAAVAAGLGAAGTATGIYALVLDDEYHDPATSDGRRDEIRPTGEAMQVATNVLLACGAAAAVAAIVVLLASGDEDDPATVTAAPAVSAGGAGLTLRFRL